MTLEEELRIFEFKNSQLHHHQSEEGRQALDYMREDITTRYFNKDKESFKHAYMKYQIELYQAEFQNLGDECSIPMFLKPQAH